MPADAIISELRQLEIDRLKHEKAIRDIDARRREILEVTGTRRPTSRKTLELDDAKRLLGIPTGSKKCR